MKQKFHHEVLEEHEGEIDFAPKGKRRKKYFFVTFVRFLVTTFSSSAGYYEQQLAKVCAGRLNLQP
jgi:hypothetical protein